MRSFAFCRVSSHPPSGDGATVGPHVIPSTCGTLAAAVALRRYAHCRSFLYPGCTSSWLLPARPRVYVYFTSVSLSPPPIFSLTGSSSLPPAVTRF